MYREDGCEQEDRGSSAFEILHPIHLWHRDDLRGCSRTGTPTNELPDSAQTNSYRRCNLLGQSRYGALGLYLLQRSDASWWHNTLWNSRSLSLRWRYILRGHTVSRSWSCSLISSFSRRCYRGRFGTTARRRDELIRCKECCENCSKVAGEAAPKGKDASTDEDHPDTPSDNPASVHLLDEDVQSCTDETEAKKHLHLDQAAFHALPATYTRTNTNPTPSAIPSSVVIPHSHRHSHAR